MKAIQEDKYGARIFTPYYMREHRERAEAHLKESVMLEVLKDLKNGEYYSIRIGAESKDNYECAAIETRVKIEVSEIPQVTFCYGIDHAFKHPVLREKRRKKRGWRAAGGRKRRKY